MLLSPFVMLLFCGIILALAFWQKTPLQQLGITKNLPIITLILFGGYIVLFIINGDFSLMGVYWALFYLVLVGFGEEFMFRGYVFSSLHNECSFTKAAIISGVFFALPHYFRDTIASGAIVFSPGSFVLYIALGAVLAFILKKTGSIWIVSIIHGYMNYAPLVLLQE